MRIDCHKIHTVALIASTRQRNAWVNDPLLHARLLSLTPLHLQTAFAVIHKSRVPDQNQRGRIFEKAIENLTEWWTNSFFEVIPDGHIRNRTFDEIQQKLEIRGLHVKDESDPEATIEVETLQDIVEDEVETIRSSKSLMKHALMQNGSRDTSAQLFTALCRGLGIPARLVVSVQSVPWQASVGKPKTKYEKKPKLKGKEFLVQESEAGDASSSSKWDQMSDAGRRVDGGPVPMSEKAKGKMKAKPIVKLRKTKSKGHVLGTALAPLKLASPDPLTTPPVYWTEVFSRPDSRWLPVDPIRGIVNKRKSFDPTPSTSSVNTPTPSSLFPPYTPAPQINRRIPNTRVENRMVYVIAFEEDGYARDVTRRYAKEFGAKVAKVQGGSSAPNMAGGGKGRQAWWEKVVKSIERPYRLNRDDLEDQELQAAQLMEGMPTTMTGFKDHPLYALARHLKQTETIHPPPPATPELGKFRGEPVYPRSSIVSLKTAENWMRNLGRSVKQGEQPMKMVKLRAGTVNRMRELEVLKDELTVAGRDEPNGEGSSTAEIMQGLYAFSQTEPYVPEPVINGKVPKNNFGNIDLYVPSMLPKGAVHIPFKGVAKIARKLGFDYAEAVTGFEFKKRRAFPIVEGVVVAAQNEATILEAYWEAERETEEKARIKREERVLKQWTRLVQGLRIRQRLQEKYSTKPGDEREERSHKAKLSRPDNETEPVEELPHDDPSDSAGGFLAGADRVVHAFHLPRNTHVVLSSPLPRNVPLVGEELEETTTDVPDFVTYDLDTMDVDSEMEEVVPTTNLATHHIPKTMQQIAEDAAAQRQAVAASDADDEEVIMTSPLVSHPGEKATIKIALPSNASTPNSLSNRGTPLSTRAKGKSKPSTTKRAGTRKSKRKRTKKDASELDSGDLSDEEDEEQEPEEEHKPSPSKRSRVKATPVTTPATRTLRPRTSKTPAQIAEARQFEEAYRKAVAG
ncbi:hypothetical protein GALMADRAFT_238668 [Galerina marginata CBS 339.88]|uniref:Rad4 beta-hairpin domain-containing protein n=1 Tax=Galerina marginata (strain CBS 339.88) TaxID=685588 RepID=A0A067TIM4_GALM3|nr:hypothetical protein GALMADRAFT_238668 [Galerina marginata CBS 339.88]